MTIGYEEYTNQLLSGQISKNGSPYKTLTDQNNNDSALKISRVTQRGARKIKMRHKSNSGTKKPLGAANAYSSMKVKKVSS